MFNVSPKTKRNEEIGGIVVRGLLARAPKTIVVVAVVLADLVFSSGLFMSRPRLQSAGSAQITPSCERGSCQRQLTDGRALENSASIPTGKPRLLEFTSKHCASCGRMAPLVRKLEHDCTARDGTILPVDVNTDSGDLLATRYVVNELPTFIMIDSNGAEVSRLVGEQPRQRLAVALADVNGVICTVL